MKMPNVPRGTLQLLTIKVMFIKRFICNIFYKCGIKYQNNVNLS